MPSCRRVLSILLILVSFFSLSEWRSLPLMSTAVAAPAAFSDWERWDEGLPSFAPVLSLVAAPEHPGFLYAGTHNLPGLWLSMDGGETWEREGQGEGPGPSRHPVFTLLWDAGRQWWWAGTRGGLFFRPFDSSVWQPVPELEGPVFSLARDEAGRIYAAQADEGLFRLEGDGDWACIRREPRVLAIGVSPKGQRVFLGTAGSGLWLSHDGGQTWLHAPDLPEEYISTLLIDQELGRWIYAGASKQVYRSVDFGHTWQPVLGLDGRAYAFVLAPDGTLYAGLEGCVARSKNGGRTWVSVGKGLHPQMPVLDLIIVGQPGDSYVLYAATRDGVYRSTDEGRTWRRHRKGLGGIEVEALAWDGEGGMIAATPSGLYRRPADGENWELVAQAFRYKHFYDLSSDVTSRTIYAGMQSGLVRSTDSGKTWEEVISDLTPHGMLGVLVDPEDPNHVFVRLAFERIYESHDGGRNWEARWEGMETRHEVLSMARSSSGELWAGTQDGLFGWDPQGKRWQREALPLTNTHLPVPGQADMGQSVFAIAFDSHGDADLSEGETGYVGTTEGLWCRRDGSRWRRCASKTIKNTVTALAVLPRGHIYAGTQYAGLYRSCDGGATWHRVSGIPTDSTVNALLADPQDCFTCPDRGTVYVATDHGIFRGKDTVCPPSETSFGDGEWEGLGDSAGLRRTLSLLRRCPPVHSLPAIHTLRADDALLQQARDIGFRAILQVLSWEEIEPTRGEWHWEYPDFLVQAADFYDFGLIVRLDHPPEWALHPKGVPGDEHGFPFDVDAYLRFVEAVTQRYRGRIQGYIIWNEPNLALEWGAPPDPAAYTRLLHQAYVVVKRTDPFALLISAGLSPTNSHMLVPAEASPDEQNDQAMDDRNFLEGMYRAGARPFFDALGAHPYGFVYPPNDPHGDHEGLNMNRILDLRAIMEAHGDGSKPIWATEIGWTTRGTSDHIWLTVTPEEQADYLVRAWWKTRDEFPWLRLFTVWNLSRGLSEGDEKAGYSLLYEDGTPKPACETLREAFVSADLGRKASAPLQLLDSFLPDLSPVFILARDEEVHLGDSE
jgi:photosystem II stability/assembly factor-like uncharacterized protein